MANGLLVQEKPSQKAQASEISKLGPVLGLVVKEAEQSHLDKVQGLQRPDETLVAVLPIAVEEGE
jgi:hypothetical protein